MKKIHSRKVANKYMIKGLIILIYLSISALLIGFILNLYHSIVFALGIIFGAGTLYILEHKFLFFAGKYKGNIQGAIGEVDVADTLKEELDSCNLIVNSVVLPGYSGDIDHIVIGKHGVFVIETKTHKGKISCYGDKWYQQKIIGDKQVSTDLGWSPSNQAKRNAILLREFLKERYPKLSNVFIETIAIFPNKETKLIIKKEPDNCRIIASLKELINYILIRTLTYKTSNNNYKDLEFTEKDISELKDIFSNLTNFVEIGKKCNI